METAHLEASAERGQLDSGTRDDSNPAAQATDPDYPSNALETTHLLSVEPGSETEDQTGVAQVLDFTSGDEAESDPAIETPSEPVPEVELLRALEDTISTSKPVGKSSNLDTLLSSSQASELEDELEQARRDAAEQRRVMYDVLDVWEEEIVTEKVVVGRPKHHPRLYSGRCSGGGSDHFAGKSPYHAKCVPSKDVAKEPELLAAEGASPTTGDTSESSTSPQPQPEGESESHHSHDHSSHDHQHRRSGSEVVQGVPSRVLSRHVETDKTARATKRIRVGWVRMPKDRVGVLQEVSTSPQVHLDAALRQELEYYRNLPDVQALVDAQERAERLAAENIRLKKLLERSAAREAQLESLVKHQLKAIDAVTVTADPAFAASVPVSMSAVADILSGGSTTTVITSPIKQKPTKAPATPRGSGTATGSSQNSNHATGLSRTRVLALASSGLTDERRALAQELVAAQQTKAALALALDEARRRTTALQRIADEAVARLEARESLCAQQTDRLASKVTELAKNATTVVNEGESLCRKFASLLGVRVEGLLKTVVDAQAAIRESTKLSSVRETVEVLKDLTRTLSDSLQAAARERTKWENLRAEVETRWRKREELVTLTSPRKGGSVSLSSPTAASSFRTPRPSSGSADAAGDFRVPPTPTVSTATFAQLHESERAFSAALARAQAVFDEAVSASQTGVNVLSTSMNSLDSVSETLESDIASYLDDVNNLFHDYTRTQVAAKNLQLEAGRTVWSVREDRARAISEFDQQENARKQALEQITSELAAKISMVTTSVNEILSLRGAGSSTSVNSSTSTAPATNSVVIEAVSGLSLADLEALRQQELSSLRSLLDLYKTQDARLRVRLDELERINSENTTKLSDLDAMVAAKAQKIEELQGKLAKWNEKAHTWAKWQDDYEADRAKMYETNAMLTTKVQELTSEVDSLREQIANLNKERPITVTVPVTTENAKHLQDSAAKADDPDLADESLRNAVWQAKLDAVVEQENELRLSKAKVEQLRNKLFADARQLQIELDGIHQRIQREASMVKQTLIVLANELFNATREADDIVAETMTSVQQQHSKLTAFQRTLRDQELSANAEEKAVQLALRTSIQNHLNDLIKEESRLESIRASQVRQANALTAQRELILSRLMQLDEAVAAAQTALDARLEAEARTRIEEEVITVLDAATQTHTRSESASATALSSSTSPAPSSTSPISRSPRRDVSEATPATVTSPARGLVKPLNIPALNVAPSGETPRSSATPSATTGTQASSLTSTNKTPKVSELRSSLFRTSSTSGRKVHTSTSRSQLKKPIPMVVAKHDQEWQD